MQFAECIYKKNWDQVGPGPARLCRVPEGQRAEENEGNALPTSPPKRTGPRASSGRFLGLVKDKVDARV